jgi:hypothetical protein
MQNVALSWLVYRLTDSPYWLGIMECASSLPILAFGLLAGKLADRFDKRRTIICTQSLAMCQALVLAYLTLTHKIVFWHCLMLGVLAGTISAWEVPSRQALIVDLIDRKDLVNAISLNSSLVNSARFIGPAMAGILVAKYGEGLCFSINAFSYLSMLLALFSMRLDKKSAHDVDANQTFSLREAFQFVLKDEHIRPALCLSLITTLFAMQYTVLLPVVARVVLHGDVKLLGALRAVSGLGALCAALSLANRARGEFLKRAVGLAAFAAGIGLIFFGLSTNLKLSLSICLVIGFSMTSLLSGTNSLIQLGVTDRLRGRVMSIYMTIMLGMSPIGSYFVGWAASVWGASATIVFCAAITAMAGLTYSLYVRGRRYS